jgi:hypothetical protein
MNNQHLDHTSEIGSRRLAALLRDYWKARGHDITVTIDPVLFGPKVGNPYYLYCVRSNLVDGLPPKPITIAAAVESTAA